FHVGYGDKIERVPAKEMIHAKAIADSNDSRGIPLLEVVAKRLTNYDLWEEYRMTLNRFRSSIALIRKMDATAAQASQMIAQRGSPRPSPTGREPVTGSGRREAMFKPGTILNAPLGTTYDFIAPNLQATDASEDGRRIL